MKAITTKYFGATDRSGARIKASDGDGNAVVIPYPYELSGEAVHRKAALKLCEKMKWGRNIAGGATKTGYAFVFIDRWVRFVERVANSCTTEYTGEARQLLKEEV